MNHNFKRLEIWIRSRQLVKEIYIQSRKFPNAERFGLTSQIQRSAVSIPSNIAEGCGRSTKPQLHHFLDIAVASTCELETQIYLANDLGFITLPESTKMLNEVVSIRKMTIQFQKSAQKNSFE